MLRWKKFDGNIIAGDMVLNQDFKEFIQSLNDNGVRYLVVGGYAVALHSVDFSDCYSSRTTVEVDGVSVNFIDLKNLKKNKKATARHQDLADLENLE